VKQAAWIKNIMTRKFMNRFFPVLICISVLAGCSKMPKLDSVLPDSRDTYRGSRSLPDLEVPPDLTLEDDDETMAIPGEEPATLTEFQRMKRQQSGTYSTIQVLENQFPGEQALAVKGTPDDVWPRLTKFFEDKGYIPELSDYELGVLETGWKQDEKKRDKFKVFAEPDDTGLNTVLLLSSEQQENVGLDDDNAEWLDQESDSKKEKKMMAALRKEFYGDAPVTAETESGTDSTSGLDKPASQSSIKREQAEIVSAGENKLFLTLPEEYTRAWRQTETLILESGMLIQDKDQEKGLYYVLFSNPGNAEEEKGFFSKLKFWGDDEPAGKPYQISLTGVGDKTELVVLNGDGDWETGTDASDILSLLQKQYNGS